MSSLQVDTAAGWSASAHRPNQDDYLKKEHIEPHMWPPNSRDINLVDYAIWGALQQRVYHQRQFKTVEELKRVIVTEWQNSQSVSLITVSVNGVDVLKLLSRMVADTLQLGLSSRTSI